MRVNSYLTFNGNCESAFKFYEKCLGGKIQAMMPHEGTPMASHVPENWRNKILHAAMSLGDELLMGSDAPPDHYQKPQGFSVTLNVNDTAESERIFRELSQDGSIQMPLQETFWAKRFGMFTDRFGIPWMINCASAA
jgi:PhnB protein